MIEAHLLLAGSCASAFLFAILWVQAGHGILTKVTDKRKGYIFTTIGLFYSDMHDRNYHRVFYPAVFMLVMGSLCSDLSILLYNGDENKTHRTVERNNLTVVISVFASLNVSLLLYPLNLKDFNKSRIFQMLGYSNEKQTAVSRWLHIWAEFILFIFIPLFNTLFGTVVIISWGSEEIDRPCDWVALYLSLSVLMYGCLTFGLLRYTLRVFGTDTSSTSTSRRTSINQDTASGTATAGTQTEDMLPQPSAPPAPVVVGDIETNQAVQSPLLLPLLRPDTLHPIDLHSDSMSTVFLSPFSNNRDNAVFAAHSDSDSKNRISISSREGPRDVVLSLASSQRRRQRLIYITIRIELLYYFLYVVYCVYLTLKRAQLLC